MASQAYHLPSRILRSPPPRASSQNPSSGGAQPVRMEMTQLYSPSPSYRSPSTFHTPSQELAFDFPSPPPMIRQGLLRPLQLSSSHHSPTPSSMSATHHPEDFKHPLNSGEDPFDDAKVLDVRTDVASGFDQTPPVSPASLIATADPIKTVPRVIKPTISLLFSLSSLKDKLTLVLPAFLFSLAAGIVPPYMTFVLGEAFNVFAAYQTDLHSSTPDLFNANAVLRHNMLKVAIKLIILGVLAVTFTTASLAIWLIHGEKVTMYLRRVAFVGIVNKPLAWYDLGMGQRQIPGEKKEKDVGDMENESSGGLMGRFARETDQARHALISEVGRAVTCLCTIVACLAVAFWHSYQLTFVILGSVPVIILVTVGVEILVTPIIVAENNIIAAAASRVERSMGAIATVKAFNAEKSEINAFFGLADGARIAFKSITMLWGFRAGFVQFLLLSMFVTGFWFGNWLVLNGKKSAGEVTIVFWSSVLATSNMQILLPLLNVLSKGEIAMASLLETAYQEPKSLAIPKFETSAHDLTPRLSYTKSHNPDESSGHRQTFSDAKTMAFLPSPTIPNFVTLQPHGKMRSQPSRPLRKIHPTKFSGELVLKDVTFYYPTRPSPSPPALDRVSLYLPARETTYIVGASGSGKSTIGSLLLGLYRPASGSIEADEQGIEWLDEHWLRSQVCMISQGASVLFEGTVHDNVALGVVGKPAMSERRPEDVTREEVVSACRAALFHDFIRDLPDGYDTLLSGEKGASLSGGQRQRLAIARAYIRDPTVLILDEAISALDTVSRTLVHDAIVKWRKNRTTIIITHDLSPITSGDFVYVIRDGRVVQEGYRQELEQKEGGWFWQLAHIQSQNSEDGPSDDIDNYYEAQEILDLPVVAMTPSLSSQAAFTGRLSARPGELGNQLRDLSQTRRASQMFVEQQQQRRMSTLSTNQSSDTATASIAQRKSSLPLSMLTYSPVLASDLALSHSNNGSLKDNNVTNKDDTSHRKASVSTGVLEKAGMVSSSRRRVSESRKDHAARVSRHQLEEVKSVSTTSKGNDGVPKAELAQTSLSLIQICKIILPIVPSRLGLVVGLVCCIGAGICTPIFSSLFSILLAGLGNPGSFDLTRTALILLLVAMLNGLADWGKYTILQHVAAGLILKLQERSFTSVINQDKSWFDEPRNSSVSLVSMLVKDAEDARNLIGYVIGNFFVVVSMVLLGLVWSFVKGWQLTLVGLAMGPLFVLSASAGTQIFGKYERLNKIQREDCAKKFYQSIANIKAIRSLSLEPVFLERFDGALKSAYEGGKRNAFLTGFGSGISFFTIYIVQAIMFYVGAIFISRGLYTFQQVLTVFVFLIFTITFSTMVLQNVPDAAKAKYAASDLLRLYRVNTETPENQGRMTFPVTGRILFDNVSFNYPSRPDAAVLENISFEIKPSECVGIVGTSGSGKSTIAALLQRLYEPTGGVIRIDGRPLPRVDVRYLRDHLAVVSQHPALFDMSVEDNIKYGSTDFTFDDFVKAAKAAHVHDFIMTLPKQYETHLGENANLMSGGQAQRLQIARALIRPREILLGDEITSALDIENQEAVLNTLMDVKKGRTTLLITHKISVMKTCDRLVVMEAGRIVQQGTYKDLISQSGSAFATLAAAGELEHT